MGTEANDNMGERGGDEAEGVEARPESPLAVIGSEADLDKLVVRVGDGVEVAEASQLGASRYVMSAFIAVGLAAAYVFGRTVEALWVKLAMTQSIIDSAPWLNYFGEQSRDSLSMVIGGIIALGVFLYVYRRRDIRAWVNESASELSKVTWPKKDEVISGTVVVMVASLIAMLYLTVLDQFWNFVTDKVYNPVKENVANKPS